MAELNLTQALDVATQAVRAGAAALLPFWRAGVPVREKPDHSPVTEADLQSEAAIVRVIREVFPSHALLTEESGVIVGDSAARWIIDPLDGTRGFIRGGTFWGPLVALEHHGEIIAGAVAMPALGETYWAARGMGAWRDGTRLRVSTVSDWSEATLSVGELSRLLPIAPGLPDLVRSCASVRAFGDVASCAMLLNGRADVWIEGGVQLWDLAASQILVEEAGGHFTDFSGKPTPASGCAIGSNGLLHSHVEAALRPS